MKNKIVKKSILGEVKLSYSKTEISDPITVKNSSDIEAYIRTIFSQENINHREHAYLIMLNPHKINVIQGWFLLSVTPFFNCKVENGTNKN